MKFDHQMFISLYEASQFGALDDNQASGIDALLSFLEQDTAVNDVRWAAYMLATVKEECADMWQPVEEIGKGQGLPYGNPVTVTDPDGNTYINTYYGRGYPQLTGEDNYQNLGEDLGLGDQLLYHPEQALDPTISYNVMSFGMRNGSFTGVGLGDFINDSQTDYVNARRIINGLDNAGMIADYATTLESLLRQSSAGEGPGPRQYHIVNAPDGVNARKGPGTSFPVVHSITNNSLITITCQVQGQVVNGTNIWNQLADGTFVSDFYCDTPNFNKFSPPLPVCQGGEQPSPGPTGPTTYRYHIVNAPSGVNARKGPGTSFPVARLVPNGSAIDITCQVQGQIVNGSNIWNQLSDGTFLSDFYCDTPNFGKFSPPIPVCQGARQASPVPPQPSPGPTTYRYHIVNAPAGVNARKGPGTSFPVVHSVANNSAIDITCQVQGQVVNGSNIWNQLSDGTFVSDFYCDTPNFNKFSPPILVCQGVQQPSPVPPQPSPVPPGPTTYPHHIVNAPDGVNARKGPGASFPVARLVPNNSAIDITCQVQGQVVNGSNIWNQLSDGTFVSDFYCDTPNFGKFSPPIPVCQGAPQPSPGQPVIKGDDYPYKDASIDPEVPDPWNFYCRECTSFVAWRMNQLGVNFTNGMTGPNGISPGDDPPVFGNGEHWAEHATTLGFLVDDTPTVGSIAHYAPNVSGAGDLGHVAYVAQVNDDGTIVVEDYNWAKPYAYHDPPRVIPASDPTSFIHIVS